MAAWHVKNANLCREDGDILGEFMKDVSRIECIKLKRNGDDGVIGILTLDVIGDELTSAELGTVTRLVQVLEQQLERLPEPLRIPEST